MNNYVVDCYENYKEENRLTTNNARKIEFIVVRHDDEDCFWTDTYYSSKEEMETIYTNHNIKIVDHFAQDGLAPLLSQKVDSWNEDQFQTWCDYHYSVCREPSILGSSNHVIIVGQK